MPNTVTRPTPPASKTRPLRWDPDMQRYVERRHVALRVAGAAVRFVRRLVWGVLQLVLLAAGWVIKHSALTAARTVRASTVGRHRVMWVPAWLAVLAVVGAAAPTPSSFAWLALGTILGARPGLPYDHVRAPFRWLLPKRRFLSDRESALAARACALAAGWTAFVSAGPLPYVHRAGVLAVLVLAVAVPWWVWRRPRGVDVPEFHVLWSLYVVPALPSTAGEWTTWDEDAGMGVLTLADAKASTVAKLDEDVELVLARDAGLPMRRGMVTIAADPRLHVNQVRVALAGSPEDMASRSRFWEGPTLGDPGSRGRLRRPGRYLIAVTKTGQEVWVMLRDVENGRARFCSWDAPTGAGKGGSMRITILEAALDPHTMLLIADGKWGAGLGYCAAGTLSYADSPEKIREQALRVRAVLRVRARRYGDARRDSFVAGPLEPHIFWILDELPRILEVPVVGPLVASVLNEVSAIGGSLGVTFGTAKQRGDASSWGFGTAATTTRTNVAAGGWRWVGPSDDTQGQKSNAQALALDASKLPRTGGWCYIVEGNPDPEASRGIWVPNRRDVTEKGKENRYGTVEDWLERYTIHPDLIDTEYDILLGSPLPSAEPERPSAFEQARDALLTGQAAQVDAHVADMAAEQTDGLAVGEAIVRLLDDADEPMTAREVRIALDEQYGITRTDRRVRQILDDLLTAEEVVGSDGGRGVERTWTTTTRRVS